MRKVKHHETSTLPVLAGGNQCLDLRHLAIGLVFFVCLLPSFAQTTTPNLGMTSRQHGAANWDGPVSGNFTIIDNHPINPNKIISLNCAGTNDSTALNSAIGVGGIIVIPKGVVCAAGSTVTFPSSVTLRIESGGLLKAITGQTVTLAGPLGIGNYTAFTNIGPGQGSLSFAGNRSLTRISPLWFGLDCSGVGDNAPIWTRMLAFTGEDTTFVLPNNCIDMHASTVTVSSRAGFRLMSEDRVQNTGGNQKPEELWTGSNGGMWDFQANQAPTIEGFYFTNTTNLDYFLRFDGDPSTRIGTEALVRYNSFDSHTNNANFSAITISTISGQNHEKNVITDNDFYCSQSHALRETDTGQIANASHTLTCGSGTCHFTTDAQVADRVRVSYAAGIVDTTISSITDNNHLQMAAAAASNQSNARVDFREAFGNGITIGSPNSKHNVLERDSFTQCAKGLNVLFGSFSASHFGGTANDVLAYVQDVTEPSELAYLEDENSLRDVFTSNLDAPLTLSHLRNSLLGSAESDGFIYFSGAGRITVTASQVQDTPVTNSVLIRAADPTVIQLTSVGNSWLPGVMTMANLGFSQWRTAAEAKVISGGFLVSCGDAGITDQPGACFQFGDGGPSRTEGNIVASSPRRNSGDVSFSVFTAQPNAQVIDFAHEATGFKTNFLGLVNSTSMKFVGFDAAFKTAIQGGNSAGFRFTMPTVSTTPQPFSRGLWVAAPTANTSITTASGVYVEDLATHTGITNRYSFFGVGATDTAHFGGPIEALHEIRTTSASNTDLAGQLTIGGGGTITYTFTQTYTSAPICTVTQTSAPTLIPWAGVTTTALTVHGDVGGVVNYACIARN